MRPTSDYLISYSGEARAETLILVALGTCLALAGAVTVKTALSRTRMPSPRRFFIALAGAALFWVAAVGASVFGVTTNGGDCGRVAHAISGHGVPGYDKEAADRFSQPCRNAGQTGAIIIGLALAGSVACSLAAWATSRPRRQRTRGGAEVPPA